jgi:hypothetical protein
MPVSGRQPLVPMGPHGASSRLVLPSENHKELTGIIFLVLFVARARQQTRAKGGPEGIWGRLSFLRSWSAQDSRCW